MLSVALSPSAIRAAVTWDFCVPICFPTSERMLTFSEGSPLPDGKAPFLPELCVLP